MKNTFKIEFHLLYYLFALICFLTGYFKDFIWISLLIIIHELGHLTGALLCRWNVKKIKILPFGGMTILNEQLNRPIYQEFIILLMGPIYQVLFFFLLIVLNKNHPLFELYHYGLLIFNLLPIIPLDGSKLLNLVLEYFFSYRFSKKIVLVISTTFLFFFFISAFIYKNLIILIIVIFLIIQNIKYFKEFKYIIKKFIFERYLYDFKFNKVKKINDINKMKRDYYHIFILDGSVYSEKVILDKYFKT